MIQGEPTVFVVDDDKAMRESLCWLIESVGLPYRSFARAEDFLRSYDPAQPGCLLLDVRMAGMSGIELHERLRQRAITMPVIIITGHGDVPMAVRAMKAGAFDFFEKPFNDQALLERVRQAIESDGQYRRRLEKVSQIRLRIESLSPREAQVMALVAAGRLNKQIAAQLAVSEKTVESHRASLMKKMRAASVVELVRMALAVEHEDGA